MDNDVKQLKNKSETSKGSFGQGKNRRIHRELESSIRKDYPSYSQVINFGDKFFLKRVVV